jgi:hypothetical protein
MIISLCFFKVDYRLRNEKGRQFILAVIEAGCFHGLIVTRSQRAVVAAFFLVFLRS